MEKAAPQPTKQARPTQPAAGKAPRRTTLSGLRRQRIEESPCVVEREEPNEEASRQRAYAEAVVDEFEVFEVDDEGRVHYHRDRHVDASLYGLHACSLGGTPAVWDGSWYLFGPAALKYMIGLTMRGATDREVTSMTKRVLNAIEFERRYELPSPDLIAFKNGILNVRTMELQEGRRVTYRDRIPNRIPHEIDLEAPADADVEKFLELASDGHQDVRRNLLQLIFLCMSRHIRHEQVVVLVGPGGGGKSRFVDVVLELVGESNASHLPLGRMANRFEVGDLAAMTVNVSSDLAASFMTSDKTAIWKQVSGADPIKADAKGLPGFVFRPYCQLLVVCNRFPRIEGGIDDSISRRFQFIPFTHRFKDRNGEYLPDADPDIVEKVCRPAGMAYLIRLAVEEGHRMMVRPRGFKMDTNYFTLSEVHKLSLENSTVLAWIDHLGLEERDFHRQRKTTMLARYQAYCKRSGVKAVSNTTFYDDVLEAFPGLREAKPRAMRYTVGPSGIMTRDRTVQYEAFAVTELYERETSTHVQYVEVVLERHTLTSVSLSNGQHDDMRKNFRVEDVQVGVWPATGLQQDGSLPKKWLEDSLRYEE